MKIEFDVIDTIGNAFAYGYKTAPAWLRWSILPVILTFITSVSAHVYEVNRFPFWLAVISVPELFMRGWFSVKIVRFCLLGEVGPIPRAPDQARQLAAGILCFVIVNYILLAISGVLLKYDMSVLSAHPDPKVSVAMLFGVVAGIWSVRYLWLFIPAGVGYSIKRFLGHLSGWMGSVYVIAIVLICYLPVYVALFLIVGMFEATGISFKEFDGAQAILLIGLSVVADMIASALIAVTGASLLKKMAGYDIAQQKIKEDK